MNDVEIPLGWLSYTQAAARYGISVSQLRRLAGQGRIQRYTRPNRRPRVLLSTTELDAVLGGQPRPLKTTTPLKP